MSQYPSPYTPPSSPLPYSAGPVTPDVLLASRRASLLMFVLGGLTLIMGTCMLATIVAMPAGQLGQQMQQSAAATGQSLPFSSDQFKTLMIVFLTITLLVAIAFIGLGTGIRRGGKGSTIAGIILTGLMLAFLGIQAVGTLVMAVQAPAGLAVVVMLMIPLSVLVLLMVWLIGSLKAIARSGSQQQQYAAQYWQYQQNMQAYAYAQAQQESSPQGYATAPQPPAVPAAVPTNSSEKLNPPM